MSDPTRRKEGFAKFGEVMQFTPPDLPGDVFLDVDGRIEDYVVTPDGRWIGRLDHIFKEQLDVAEAQIVQETAEAIEVRIVPRPSFDARAEAGLLKEIRSRVGDQIRIELVRLQEIPREPKGKFQAVKSAVGRLQGRDPGRDRDRSREGSVR